MGAVSFPFHFWHAYSWMYRYTNHASSQGHNDSNLNWRKKYLKAVNFSKRKHSDPSGQTSGIQKHKITRELRQAHFLCDQNGTHNHFSFAWTRCFRISCMPAREALLAYREKGMKTKPVLYTYIGVWPAQGRATLYIQRHPRYWSNLAASAAEPLPHTSAPAPVSAPGHELSSVSPFRGKSASYRIRCWRCLL